MRCIHLSPIQGLAPPGQLAGREQFASLAKENAGSLAEVGDSTTLNKIGFKAMDFGRVTHYWMQERPDHLVQFHVTLLLEHARAGSKFYAPGRRSGIFHRLRIRRQGPRR